MYFCIKNVRESEICRVQEPYIHINSFAVAIKLYGFACTYYVRNLLKKKFI